MSSWISVEDKLPNKSDAVLTNCKHGLIEGTFSHIEYKGVGVFNGYYWQDMSWFATHWMPLPEPPNDN